MAKIPTQQRANTNKTKYETVPEGLYPARLVRFVGLGSQPQPEYQGQVKDPAPKVAAVFELYDQATGEPLDSVGIDSDGNEVKNPACVFQDYFLFPGATRGKVFELSESIDSKVQKVADDFDWFIERLGAPVQVQVVNYPKKDGSTGAKVKKTTGLSPMISRNLPPARSELVGFDPYEQDPKKYEKEYAKLFNFQRGIIKDALDAQYIPLAGTEPIKLDDAEHSAPQEESKGNPYTSEPNVYEEDDGDDRPF